MCDRLRVAARNALMCDGRHACFAAGLACRPRDRYAGLPGSTAWPLALQAAAQCHSPAVQLPSLRLHRPAATRVWGASTSTLSTLPARCAVHFSWTATSRRPSRRWQSFSGCLAFTRTGCCHALTMPLTGRETPHCAFMTMWGPLWCCAVIPLRRNGPCGPAAGKPLR